MNYIKRPHYLDFLRRHRDRQIIKVVSGVRRAGKSVLFQLYKEELLATGVDENQIISINFEDLSYYDLRHFQTLFAYIKERLVEEKTYYIFLDEIQHVEKFELVADSLFILPNVDLYLTGSNAYFMSSQLATNLTGRYVEIEVLPLSFEEYLSGQSPSENLNTTEIFNKYLFSAFPYLLQTSSYAEKIGVQIDNLLISQPDNGEQALEICETLVRSNAVDLIVVDSVAALTPKAEIDGDMGDAQMGLQARLMSQAMRKLTAIISKSKATVIFINQIRMKLGVMFGNPETTTGGNALKFYASVRVDIRRIGQIKNGEDIIGNRTKIKVVKNKIAAPFRTAEFDIMYNEGISKTGDVLDLAVQYGVLDKAGAFLKYNGETIGQGREAVKRLFKESPELFAEIEEKVRAKAEEGQK